MHTPWRVQVEYFHVLSALGLSDVFRTAHGWANGPIRGKNMTKWFPFAGGNHAGLVPFQLCPLITLHAPGLLLLNPPTQPFEGFWSRITCTILVYMLHVPHTHGRPSSTKSRAQVACQAGLCWRASQSPEPFDEIHRRATNSRCWRRPSGRHTLETMFPRGSLDPHS